MKVASASTDAKGEPTAAPNARRWAWAALVRRAFAIEVLVCPRTHSQFQGGLVDSSLTHRFVDVNGVRLHIAEQGSAWIAA